MINPKNLAEVGISAVDNNVLKTVVDGALKNKAMDQKFKLDKMNMGLRAIDTVTNVMKTYSDCKVNEKMAKAQREKMVADSENRRAEIAGKHQEVMTEIEEKYSALRENNERDNEIKRLEIRKSENIALNQIKLEAGKAVMQYEEHLDKQAKEHLEKMSKQEQDFVLACIDKGLSPVEATEIVAQNLERLGIVSPISDTERNTLDFTDTAFIDKE